MKNTSEHVDLRVLERTAKYETRPPKRKKVGVIVAAIIVIGFAAILVTSLGDLLRKRIAVTVVRPSSAPATGTPAGTVVFQAAGWAEPDPFAMKVGALTTGVVREVLVQESDVIRAGDVVARLVDEDAKIALSAADAALERAEAEMRRSADEARFTHESFDLALDLEENVRTAAAELAGKTAETARRAETVRRGAAEVQVAVEELATQEFLAKEGAAGPRQVELAKAKVESARAALATMEAEKSLADADLEKAKARVQRLDREKATRIEDKKAVALADRQAETAKAAVAEARAARDLAALTLDRTSIRAPAAGVVLARVAVPGNVVGPSAEHETICTLWDPQHLRVRVDIPQAEIRRVSMGQEVLVTSEARPNDPYRGRVIRIVQAADIQKVTMQVHVKIETGDALIRPEMLVQARFLAPKPETRPANADAAADRTVVRVPARLVLEGGFVWVVAPDALRAKKKKVEVGPKIGDAIEITSGVNVTDKLIDEGREALEDGSPIQIRTEN